MITSDPRLRVALVSAFPPGHQSLNEYGLHLAKGFAERSDVAEVVVLADRLDTLADEVDLGPKIRVLRVWSFNTISALFSIVAALRKERVDGALFNIQTATFGDREMPAALGLMAPAVARLSGTPSGVIAHNLIGGIDLDSTQLKGQHMRQSIIRLGGRLVTRALLSADYLTVTLESYRRMLAERYPTADIALIPHGTFDTDHSARLASTARPMRIVTMGKFGTYKRLETLLAAFDLLRNRRGFEDLELVIGGSNHPSTPGYLESIAQRRAGDRQVHFSGYVPEERIPDFFGAARVSVFDYSATTGSSGVLHQTASYGAVPVFPQIGDFIDVCRDEGLRGLHYAPGDAESMAEALATALLDTELSDSIACTNVDASLGTPFSDVLDYHVQKFRALQSGAGVGSVPAQLVSSG